MQETMELDDLQFADGFWHADNAPIYSRRKRSLLEGKRLSELKMNDLFYVNLWGGEFEARCYLMKVIRQRPKDGCFDCLWLTKKRKLLRNIVGQAMFSEVPLELRVFQQKKRKPTFVLDLTGQPTPTKKARPAFPAVVASTKLFDVEIKEEPLATKLSI